MDDELNQLIDEQNKYRSDSDNDDLVSRCDFEEFETRLKTGQSFVREKPTISQRSSNNNASNLKELNATLQQKMMRQQQQQLQQSQRQVPPKSKVQQQAPTKEPSRKSVDARQNSVKQLLEQNQRDNQELLQKCKLLTAQKKKLEQELEESKTDVMRRTNMSGMSMQRQESTNQSELKLLRIENEELKRTLTRTFDQSKLIKDLTLQVAKLKCKVDDLQMAQQKQQ